MIGQGLYTSANEVQFAKLDSDVFGKLKHWGLPPKCGRWYHVFAVSTSQVIRMVWEKIGVHLDTLRLHFSKLGEVSFLQQAFGGNKILMG